MTPAERGPGPVTPGMDRRRPSPPREWSGFLRTEPGMVSGWHHHVEYETVIYVLSGTLKMEFGPNGSNAVEAGPDDFVYVPKGAVHRESNPSTARADAIVVRAGVGGVHIQRGRAGAALTIARKQPPAWQARGYASVPQVSASAVCTHLNRARQRRSYSGLIMLPSA